jgi:hypothetical protein
MILIGIGYRRSPICDILHDCHFKGPRESSKVFRLDSPLHLAAVRFDSSLHHAAVRFDSPLHHTSVRFDSPAGSYNG